MGYKTRTFKINETPKIEGKYNELVYKAPSCCTRNRVKNLYLSSDMEQEVVKLFLHSNLSKFRGQD